MRNLVLSAFAAGALLASPAQAVTVSAMVPVSPVEISGTLSVDQFAPPPGTMLTGVSFVITGMIESLITISNAAPRSVTATAATTVDFDLVSSLIPLAASPDFSVTGSTGTQTLASGETVALTVTGSNSISGMVVGDLTAFIGTGTVAVLDFFTTTSFNGSGFGGDISFSQLSSAGISLDITYEFDAVAIPLPATAPLLAAAAGLFLFVGRKRARRLS